VIFRCVITYLAVVIMAGTAVAENEMSFFAGVGVHRPGTLTYDINGDARDADGATRSGPLFGMRYTHWVGTDGIGVEYSRDFATQPAFDDLDQLTGSDDSIFTLNYHKVFPDQVFDPYVGLGVGVLNTSDAQLAGPAMRFSAGGRYALNDVIDVMAEYQFTYSQNLSDPETLGGRAAEQHRNAINLGISFGF